MSPGKGDVFLTPGRPDVDIGALWLEKTDWKKRNFLVSLNENILQQPECIAHGAVFQLFTLGGKPSGWKICICCMIRKNKYIYIFSTSFPSWVCCSEPSFQVGVSGVSHFVLQGEIRWKRGNDWMPSVLISKLCCCCCCCCFKLGCQYSCFSVYLSGFRFQRGQRAAMDLCVTFSKCGVVKLCF